VIFVGRFDSNTPHRRIAEVTPQESVSPVSKLADSKGARRGPTIEKVALRAPVNGRTSRAKRYTNGAEASRRPTASKYVEEREPISS